MTTLNNLSLLCHARSKDAGWWKDCEKWRREDDGRDTAVDANVLGTKTALIHSEVSEMLEGMRKGLPDKHLPHRSAEEVECADALIRIFDYAGARGLDLDGALYDKLEYNAVRPDHKLTAREGYGGKSI